MGAVRRTRGESEVCGPRNSSSFKGTVGLLHHLECLHLESSLPVLDAGRDSSRLHLRPEMHSLMSVNGRRSQRVLTETGTEQSGSTLPLSTPRRPRWCTGSSMPPTTPPSP